MTGSTAPHSELFVFKDEPAPLAPAMGDDAGRMPRADQPWKVLIVDDEAEVHKATLFALKHLPILGRTVRYLHAYSAAEARQVLLEQADIAVVLLDVVMETANAGLELVAYIRSELKIDATRIILRTGEPNQAPEMDIIRDFDINDYKHKAELDRTKLFVSLTAAVRSYQQIKAIESGKKGLDLILRSSSELLTQPGLNRFSEGVITHIAALLGVPAEGLLCVRKSRATGSLDASIIAAAGGYRPLKDKPLTELQTDSVRTALLESLDHHRNVFHRDGVALYLGSHSRGEMSCFVAAERDLREVDKSLLEMFCQNVSLCADNIIFMERLKGFAFTDTLLGIPNRNSLEGIVDNFIQSHSAVPHALALIDIDNFAEINAALGQEYGDQLLRAVADRLSGRFYAPNTVARVGGDTFAVFGPLSHIDRKALLAPFVNPFQINGELQLVSVTAGIVPLTEDDGSGAELIKDASIVLKQAKNHSRGEVVMFEARMMQEAKSRLEMLKNLRAAFDLNQLFLVFQPKLRLSDLSVSGFEALLRWRDSQGRFISPGEFIPLAEQSGLIIRMGEWILRNAIAELALLRAKGYRDACMAVNLSVAQLEHPDVLEMLRRVMGESDISPGYIELEITESIAMGDMTANLARLQAIRDMGFGLSMDDFGTGFSSLTYLQKMPINCLKIDRSFVSTSNTPSGREIVEMIVQLGKTLGLNVIAEGVEEEVQGVLLKEMGCHEVQGYFYAKPMPRTELHQWLANRRTLTVVK